MEREDSVVCCKMGEAQAVWGLEVFQIFGPGWDRLPPGFADWSGGN